MPSMLLPNLTLLPLLYPLFQLACSESTQGPDFLRECLFARGTSSEPLPFPRRPIAWAASPKGGEKGKKRALFRTTGAC